MTRRIVVATRGSQLALVQSESVIRMLKSVRPDIDITMNKNLLNTITGLSYTDHKSHCYNEAKILPKNIGVKTLASQSAK